MFQAVGNTVPSLLSSASRLLTFVLPVIVIARLPGFHLQQAWTLSVATVAAQAVLSLWLLRREFRLKLRPAATA
jgi:Na+-driven multidrug efflux pump